MSKRDDREPIDEEWVSLVIGRQTYWPTIWVGADVNIVEGTAWKHGKKLCDVANRGDLRRLAKQIGYELKEPTP